MEILKLIVSLPKWIFLLFPRVFIALLNLFPSWSLVYFEDTFFNEDQNGNSCPVQRLVLFPEKLQFGHWIVAYIRGKIIKISLSENKEIQVVQKKVEKYETKKDSIIKSAIHKDRLNEIISDCKILSN